MRDITGRMRHAMDGILEISGCMRNDENKKTLASKGISIEYEMNIQLPETFPSSRAELISADRYLAQHEIIAEKKQKKSIKMKKVDIRQMIRSLECIVGNGKAVLEMQLDAGSISNLNPELVINTFMTGMMESTMTCESSTPKQITTPIGIYRGLWLMIIGKTPKAVVAEVRKMGRILRLPANMTASLAE